MDTKERIRKDFEEWDRADDDETIKENRFYKVEQDYYRKVLRENREDAKTYKDRHGGPRIKKTYAAFYVYLYHKFLDIPIKELCADVGVNRSYYYDLKEKITRDEKTQLKFSDYTFIFTGENDYMSHVKKHYKELLEKTG